MSNWIVEYEIDGKLEAILVPDGSNDTDPLRPYVGYDEQAFEDLVKQKHPGVSMDDVEVTFSMEEDDPLATFFKPLQTRE